MPRVSVLLPAFGAARTIRSALRSVRRQTFRDFECVVVDDGSTDATAEIAVAFASGDPRFRVVRRRHEGLVPALDAGLAECRGELIARMDADDVMMRDRLERQVAALDDDATLAAVGAHAMLAPRRGLQEGALEYEVWIASIDSPARVAQDLFVECPIVHPTLVVRASVIRELGGYRDRGVPEDYDLVLRIAASGRRIGVVPRPLLVWRQGESRLQKTSAAYSHDAFARLKAEFLVTGFLRDEAPYHLIGFGNSGKRMRLALAKEGRTPAAIVDLHRKGNVVDGVPIVGADALATLPRRKMIVCVAGAAGRAEIRRELRERGFADGADFVCCA